MQSHNEDTTQQATSHSLQSESHDSATGAIPPSFSDTVPTHTTQTERTWMTESHSLYFTKRIPDSTSFVPSPKVVSLVTLILNFHFSPRFRNLRFLVTNGSGRRVSRLFPQSSCLFYQKLTNLPNWSFPCLPRPIQLLSQASSSSLSSMLHQCGAALPHQSRRHLPTALPSPNDRLYFPHASHAQPDPLSHKSRW